MANEGNNKKILQNLMYKQKCSMVFTKSAFWAGSVVESPRPLIRKVWSFGSSFQEIVELWKTCCRSILEQTRVVWDSGLTNQNIEDLERTQKTFVKLIMEEDFQSYTKSLSFLNLETLESHRKKILLKFAKTSITDGHFRDLFPLRGKTHDMKTRIKEKYFMQTLNATRILQ